jgi:hypothetical protein
MAKISDFLNYGVGDIITLSDLQTQKEFKKMEADFQIIETREYRHPEGIFTYTGYLASYKATPEAEEQQILLLIRQVGDDFDLRVFFMDSDGPSESYEDLFVIDEDDLVDRFDVIHPSRKRQILRHSLSISRMTIPAVIPIVSLNGLGINSEAISKFGTAVKYGRVILKCTKQNKEGLSYGSTQYS